MNGVRSGRSTIDSPSEQGFFSVNMPHTAMGTVPIITERAGQPSRSRPGIDDSSRPHNSKVQTRCAISRMRQTGELVTDADTVTPL